MFRAKKKERSGDGNLKSDKVLSLPELVLLFFSPTQDEGLATDGAVWSSHFICALPSNFFMLSSFASTVAVKLIDFSAQVQVDFCVIACAHSVRKAGHVDSRVVM
ncbi:unnamed protein product [Amoebophrya sp. A120]|nr:unnamed protein product [Amoebophrya sp. A120]|eukprot:GSA120T00016849001.1